MGLWRTGASWALPVLLIGGLVMGVLDAGRWPLALGFALTWAGLAVAGLRLLRGSGPGPARPDATGERQGGGVGLTV